MARRFRIRTLLVMMFLACCVLFWVNRRITLAKRQQNAADQIISLGGTVHYRITKPFQVDKKPTLGSRLLRLIIGDVEFAPLDSLTLDAPATAKEEELTCLADLPHLRNVGFAGEAFGDRAMEHLTTAEELQILTLTDVGVTCQGWRHLSRFQRLRTFHLEYTATKSSAAATLGDEDLAALANLKELDSLMLIGVSISGRGLRRLRGLDKLRYLHIEGGDLSQGGFEHLEDLPSLRFLVLPNANIDDQGAAQIAKLSQISALHLQGNPLSDDGVIPLAKLGKLRTLRIHDTQISDRCLPHFLPCKHLNSLSIGPEVTEGAAMDFKAAKPACRIALIHPNKEGYPRRKKSANPLGAIP